MDVRDVLHHLIDCSGMRWPDEDGRRGDDAHEAVDRHFLRPDLEPEPPASVRKKTPRGKAAP